MEWFTVWWQGLGLVGQIMACAAIPMTVVMLLQLILMIIGLGPGGDSDSDFDDGGFDHGDYDHGGFDHGGLDHGGFDHGEFDHGGLDHGGFDHDGLDHSELDHGGFHERDAAFDSDHPAHEAGSNTNSIWRIFTIRGIVAFFALGGWAGLAALTAGVPVFWAIQIAVFSGVAALMLASIAIRLALRMQDSGNLNLANALSHTAEVYITVPPSRTNTGKVTMLLQERFVELEAVTDSDCEIRPKTKVEVIGLADKDCLVVRPVEENNE